MSVDNREVKEIKATIDQPTATLATPTGVAGLSRPASTLQVTPKPAVQESPMTAMDLQVRYADSITSNWDIKQDPKNNELITARNSITGSTYVGTIKDFNRRIKSLT
jgi:hypothetical protein